MRQRKPRINLAGHENEHCIVLRTVRADWWIVQCKHCGEEHEIEDRLIKKNGHTRKCPLFKPHNHSGLDRWDAIVRRTYGISLAEYDAIVTEQGGGCAICGVKQDVGGRRLAIDHCHDSKAVRGVLCAQCNQGLGHFKDDPELLRKAAVYISNAR